MSESGPRTRVLSLVRFYEDWLKSAAPVEFTQRAQLRRELSERTIPTQSHEAPLRAVSSYPLLIPSGNRTGGVQKRRRRPSQPFVPTRKSDAEAQTVIEVKQAVKEKREKTRRKRDTKKRRVSAHPKLEKLDHIKPEEVEVPLQLNIYPAQEILSSERSYVNSLLMMSHAYLKPIEDGRQTLSVDSYRIFANIRSIIELNKIFLTHLEGRQINQWNKLPKTEQLLGDLFVDQADLFKIYIEYCVNYHEAYALVQELKHNSESFNRFAAKNNQYGSLLDLNDLLIMPVQRVPRYKMLLENLLKFTLESHPDYENLKAAIEKMGALADLINAKLKEQKSQRRMAYIASRLPEESSEAADLIAPTRRLIAEFTFTMYKVKVHSGGEVQTLAKPQQVYFFLFNDKILLAKGYTVPTLTANSSDAFSLPSLSSPDLGLNMIIKDTHLPAKMEPIAFMDLQSSFLRKILNPPNALTFQLVNPKGYYVLQSHLESDKNQLKESFREALVGLNNDARIKRSLIRVFTDEKSHFGICEAIEHAPAFSERILTQDLALESNKETIRALEDLLETNRVVLQSRPVTPSPMKKRREKKVIDKLKSAITVFSPKKVKARAAAKQEDKENAENLGTQAEAIVRQIDDLKKRQQELRTDGAKTPPYATPPATPRTPMATPRIDMTSTPFATPRVQEAPRTPFLERELLFETPKSERHSRRRSILGSIKKSGIKMKKADRHSQNEATPRKGVVPILDFKKMEIVN